MNGRMMSILFMQFIVLFGCALFVPENDGEENTPPAASPAPEISGASDTVISGSVFTLEATATATDKLLSFRWQRRLSGLTQWHTISDFDEGSRLLVESAGAAGEYHYRVDEFDGRDTRSSKEYTIEVIPEADEIVISPPRIVTQTIQLLRPSPYAEYSPARVYSGGRAELPAGESLLLSVGVEHPRFVRSEWHIGADDSFAGESWIVRDSGASPVLPGWRAGEGGHPRLSLVSSGRPSVYTELYFFLRTFDGEDDDVYSDSGVFKVSYAGEGDNAPVLNASSDSIPLDSLYYLSVDVAESHGRLLTYRWERRREDDSDWRLLANFDDEDSSPVRVERATQTGRWLYRVEVFDGRAVTMSNERTVTVESRSPGLPSSSPPRPGPSLIQFYRPGDYDTQADAQLLDANDDAAHRAVLPTGSASAPLWLHVGVEHEDDVSYVWEIADNPGFLDDDSDGDDELWYTGGDVRPAGDGWRKWRGPGFSFPGWTLVPSGNILRVSANNSPTADYRIGLYARLRLINDLSGSSAVSPHFEVTAIPSASLSKITTGRNPGDWTNSDYPNPMLPWPLFTGKSFKASKPPEWSFHIGNFTDLERDDVSHSIVVEQALERYRYRESAFDTALITPIGSDPGYEHDDIRYLPPRPEKYLLRLRVEDSLGGRSNPLDQELDVLLMDYEALHGFVLTTLVETMEDLLSERKRDTDELYQVREESSGGGRASLSGYFDIDTERDSESEKLSFRSEEIRGIAVDFDGYKSNSAVLDGNLRNIRVEAVRDGSSDSAYLVNTRYTSSARGFDWSGIGDAWCYETDHSSDSGRADDSVSGVVRMIFPRRSSFVLWREVNGSEVRIEVKFDEEIIVEFVDGGGHVKITGDRADDNEIDITLNGLDYLLETAPGGYDSLGEREHDDPPPRNEHIGSLAFD